MNPLTAIIEEIKRDVAGAIFLKDWLGDGAEVVPQQQAFIRGAGCLVCPKHRLQKWWERWLHDTIAYTIRRQLELKNKLNLRVSMEEDLGMCQACGCCTRLKIWPTIEHIKSHTDEATFKKLDDQCWIRREISDTIAA